MNGPLRGPLRKRESSIWERHPEDWYVEPEWCSRRLFEVEKFDGRVIDPACGCGNIVRSAQAAGLWSRGSDLVRRADEYACAFECDFLSDEWTARVEHHPVENLVSNPPFGVAEKFVEKALTIATAKVAMLLPANWVQGLKRSRWMETTPLRKVLFIAPRPSMPPGPVIEAGISPGNGTTDYAWFIWLRGYDGKPEIGWLRRDA